MTSHGAASDALGLSTWPEGDSPRGHHAVALALAVYAGHERDQGTPYLAHPVRVASLLRRELGAHDPDILILGLLHDALEVSPTAEPLIAASLGEDVVGHLRAMTPDHRLEKRQKRPGDEAAWHRKLAALSPNELLVRLADRVDNLRDLRHSPVPERRTRFLNALEETYLPLAEAARHLGPHHRTVRELLVEEYHCYRGTRSGEGTA
ncbi:HD domain-containing protein [Streptomyces blattellae]|uniref:HD domain-containing protein n=1 Tax=Streptomyces blattellae TaxID=2569855 RepID=UPI0012B8DBB4|nr:HD domain-containing protein [Streptomyces blattellae]